MGFQAFSDGKGTLTGEGEDAVIDGVAILQEAIAANNFEKGWRKDELQRPISEHVALLHSEVTEVFEAYRNNEPPIWYQYPDSLPEANQSFDQLPDGTLGKPQGITSELADVVIRALDFADEHGLPLADVLLQKHRYNQTRAYRHGGKKA